jgi:hypothetical protein
MAKSNAALNFAVTVAAGVTAGVLADRFREARAKKLAAKEAGASVGGPLADVVSATFRPGWFWALVPTERYSDPKGTPLDTAIRGGFVRRVQVVSYGPQAARSWILIEVPKAFRGPAAWELDEWATWFRTRPSVQFRDVVKDSPGPGLVTVAAEEIAARADQLGSATKAAASQVVESITGPLKVAFGVTLGAVALGLFLRAKGKRS